MADYKKSVLSNSDDGFTPLTLNVGFFGHLTLLSSSAKNKLP